MKLWRHLWFGLVGLFIFSLSCSADHTDRPDKNTVHIGLAGQPERINPLLTTQAFYKQIEWQLFMPLLQFDARSLEMHPVLATSLPEVVDIISSDEVTGRKYTFEIRETAAWDDGLPVTAADVIFSWKLQMHPEIGSPGMRRFLSFIDSVTWTTSNPRQVSFYTNQVLNLAEALIGTLPIYPAHLFDPGGDLSRYDPRIFFKNDSIRQLLAIDSSLTQFAIDFKSKGYVDSYETIRGCGPYSLAQWVDGERIVLERKTNWWADNIDDGHQSFGNNPDRIVYHFIADAAATATMLRDERLDVVSGIDPNVYLSLRSDSWMQDRYEFFAPLSLSYYFIAFNTRSPELADRKTRSAIAHLLDVDKSIEVVMNGLAQRTAGPILPVKSYYDSTLTFIPFDEDKARALLREAGWGDSNGDGILDKWNDGQRSSLSLRYKYPVDNAIAEQVGLLLQSSARRAGVEVFLQPLEFGKLIEDTRSRDFELYFGRWSQMPGLDDLRNIWHTDSDTPRGFNRSGFGNAETDAWIDSINIVPDEEERNRLYRRIQQKIYEEQPYVFLFVPTERIIIHKRFRANPSVLRPGYFEQTFEPED